MAKEQFRKYLWIVDMLFRTGGISKKELNKRWLDSPLNDSGKEIPDRSFIDYKNAIEETFDITIACNASDGYKYYIENISDIRNNNIKNWLLSSFSVNNMIQESRKLQQRIIFEQIPSGNEFLVAVINAMQNNSRIGVIYQGFGFTQPRQFTLEPYCVKVFKQRWYMACNSHIDNKIRIFALDRIKQMEQTGESFVFPETFEAAVFFMNSYGIIVDSEDFDVETIRLKVTDKNNKRQYFRSLPLHSSQKESEKQTGYSVFEYRLYPTYDFLQEILSHGAEIEILAPAWVREECAYIVEEMYKMYRKD